MTSVDGRSKDAHASEPLQIITDLGPVEKILREQVGYSAELFPTNAPYLVNPMLI